ncbi:MAG TPA: PHB depolymerase family esterase [Pirellulales bacterium]|jgi:polyhydroxybutyrate depolymerase|nr:PHB depolymerase family esterase [Pirellulales bacterium]
MDVLPLLTLICLTLAADAPLGPGDHVRHLQVDGFDRSYLVHVPPQYDPQKPASVVLAYHGAFNNGTIMVLFSGLNRKADKAGFVVVYPEGTGKGPVLFFNPDRKPRKGWPDDVRFTDKLLDDLATVVNVDPKRVYATGVSNGGMMCYRLAADLSQRIAAIAPVAGTMTFSECKPARPVSIIHFHGTKDQFVPLEGKKGVIIQFRPIDKIMRAWAAIDGCPTTPKLELLPDKANDGTRVTRTTYGPGKEGSEVVLYTIENGGHTWPGRNPGFQFLGKSTQDISANDLIWDFFQRHPMK